eukprot:m.75388 g.75388  ORF g.75388 m.75388 type:complete len:72 (-) comp8480_c1_seq2:1450-1665(-)
MTQRRSIKHPTRPESHYCFIASIIDKSLSVGSKDDKPPHSTHLLKDTADIFEGGNKTKDYHGLFDHEYFTK